MLFGRGTRRTYSRHTIHCCPCKARIIYDLDKRVPTNVITMLVKQLNGNERRVDVQSLIHFDVRVGSLIAVRH